ncbi:hypothetical protein H310_14546 [Aphanomyces invadans]|uniref:Uncharacterized protein n=1 Tax=Aphanomyces invadans TaxID=157072 RepID=A0A024TAR1_9STRA|nr:hypothetical protein H310_14546 [Aphanomyces invadans]ETV90706.1 hypothetical protein H310_14546 [Aphanomyces invadans]|eukprot:XP_008880646.1 hypothetical protein H310_14546 [Aphanomyces invadans]
MDIVDDDLSEQGPTQDAPAPDIQEKKWWTDDDDTNLLTQVNNERPFMQRKDTTKAWESMAATLRSVFAVGVCYGG